MSSIRAARPGTLALLVAVTSCATNTAPSGFLPSPQAAGTDAYGGWIELTVGGAGKRDRQVEGELLAVSAESVWVLTRGGATGVPTASVRGGHLTGWESGSGTLAAFVAIGALSTATNGALLVFTFPMWVIGGTVSTAHQSYLPEREFKAGTWPDLAVFARFPEGLPAGVRTADLRPKPTGR